MKRQGSQAWKAKRDVCGKWNSTSYKVKKIEAEIFILWPGVFAEQKLTWVREFAQNRMMCRWVKTSKFHEFHMKFLEWQQHLKLRLGFALTERCREMRERIEATEVSKLFECHTILDNYFHWAEIMTWLFRILYMQLSLCSRTTEFIREIFELRFCWKGTLVDLQTCCDSHQICTTRHHWTIEQRVWNNQTCSYLVAFLRSKLHVCTPQHQEQLQQQQTLRKDEPRELAKKQLLGGLEMAIHGTFGLCMEGMSSTDTHIID